MEVHLLTSREELRKRNENYLQGSVRFIYEARCVCSSQLQTVRRLREHYLSPSTFIARGDDQMPLLFPARSFRPVETSLSCFQGSLPLSSRYVWKELVSVCVDEKSSLQRSRSLWSINPLAVKGATVSGICRCQSNSRRGTTVLSYSNFSAYCIGLPMPIRNMEAYCSKFTFLAGPVCCAPLRVATAWFLVRSLIHIYGTVFAAFRKIIYRARRLLAWKGVLIADGV